MIRKKRPIKSYVTSATAYFLKGRNNSITPIKFMKDFAENFYIMSCLDLAANTVFKKAVSWYQTMVKIN